MLAGAEHPLHLSHIHGELRVLKITVFLMIAFAALNILAFFRLIGLPDIAPLLLAIYRVMDLIVVLSFLILCRPRVDLRNIDNALILFAFYPCVVGLARGNTSITFANDIAIYSLFVAKIIIFRTILSRISVLVPLDVIFRHYAPRIVVWCALIAVASLFIAMATLSRGATFYYQAPAELTFATALVLAQGSFPGYLVFLGLALAGGKRMVMVGLLTMAVVAALFDARLRAGMIRLAIVVVLLAPALFIAASVLFNAEIAFMDKILGTFRQFERASELSENFFETLMFLDPGRYVEYVSLQPHLTGWGLWLGNGFGFRYELDALFLYEFNFAEALDVTNAHFTPLAIVSKFGLLGLGIWVYLVLWVLKNGFDRSSFLRHACWLAFLSITIQSIFAFSFFINFFTPFYIAMATVEGPRRTSTYA